MPKLPILDTPLTRIAFFGQMGSGKSFLANQLAKNDNWIRIAFADKLKSIAYELFGVQGKDGKDRLILQQLGDNMRAIDEDVWIRYVLLRIKNQAYVSNIVIDDLRLENEAFWLKKNGFTLIRVDVDENVRLARIATMYPNMAPEAFQHASEHQVRAIVPDYTIVSNDASAIVELYKILGNNYDDD